MSVRPSGAAIFRRWGASSGIAGLALLVLVGAVAYLLYAQHEQNQVIKNEAATVAAIAIRDQEILMHLDASVLASARQNRCSAIIVLDVLRSLAQQAHLDVSNIPVPNPDGLNCRAALLRPLNTVLPGSSSSGGPTPSPTPQRSPSSSPSPKPSPSPTQSCLPIIGCIPTS